MAHYLENLRKQDHIKLCARCGHTRYMHIPAARIYAKACAECKPGECEQYEDAQYTGKKFPKKKNA